MQSGFNKSILDPENMMQGLQQLANLSLSSWKNMIDANIKMMGDAGNILGSMGISPGAFRQKETCNCCPPCEDCPPHCLLMIERIAHAGEIIIVPFAVKNTCGNPRHYKIGVRPLVNQDGQAAPSQPTLNKTEIDVQPNQSVNLLMKLDLSNGYHAGDLFQTDIVIREKDINQNICFRLKIEAFFDVPVARPLDEKKYKLHFQSWQSHYYCEPKTSRVTLTQNND